MSERQSYCCPKCEAVSYNPNDIRELYCGACHTFAESLRDEIVPQFAHLTDEHTGTPFTRRDCFSLALLTIAPWDEPRARLAHGLVRDSFHPGRWITHAWCECPAQGTFHDDETGEESVREIVIVVDETQIDPGARMLPRDWVYEQTQARDVRYYTREEALAHAIEYGHDGPWSTLDDAT